MFAKEQEKLYLKSMVILIPKKRKKNVSIVMERGKSMFTTFDGDLFEYFFWYYFQHCTGDHAILREEVLHELCH